MKKICMSLYILLACFFLVSCSGPSQAGNSIAAQKLPPELEGNPNIKGHTYEGMYYRLSVPEDYWVESIRDTERNRIQGRIYTIHDYLKDLALHVDREFDPEYYCVWILDESYEEYGKSALDIYTEWQEKPEQYNFTQYELHPEKLDVPLYVREGPLYDGAYSGFAMFDNPEGKLSYFSFLFCDEQMKEVFLDMVSNMEYVK